MAIHSDVFKAILALDFDNQGYNDGKQLVREIPLNSESGGA